MPNIMAFLGREAGNKCTCIVAVNSQENHSG